MVTSIKRDLLRIGNGKICIFRTLYLVVFDTGFLSVFLYRLYHPLYKCNIFSKFIAKLLFRFNILMTSSYLHPNSIIGGGFCLPHPVGVVIGDKSIVGEDVTIYQGVTLGRDGNKHYPEIKNHVIIYPNSTVIGKIIVNDHVTIGANTFVNKDVRARETVVGLPARALPLKCDRKS